MGGYAAETVVFGETSTGSEHDLKQATDFAFRMVAHYGMSERVGPMFHEQRVEHPFLGQRLATEVGLSDETAHLIEQEARRILSDAVELAKRLVSEKRAKLERLVAALLEHETLERSELEHVLGPARAAA